MKLKKYPKPVYTGCTQDGLQKTHYYLDEETAKECRDIAIMNGAIQPSQGKRVIGTTTKVPDGEGPISGLWEVILP